jgi:hypothetical protein
VFQSLRGDEFGNAVRLMLLAIGERERDQTEKAKMVKAGIDDL